MLACCLLDAGESLAACSDHGVGPETFYNAANRTIFEVLCEMRNAGLPIDESVLAEELERKGLLGAIGGIVRLNAITNRIPTTAHRSYFLDQLRNLEGARSVISVATRAIESCYTNQGDIAGMAATVEQEMLAATRNIESALPPLADMADLFVRPPAKPDEVICGMLHARGLMNFGGQSKARKSWVLANLALSVATGTPWIGMPTKKGKVLILNFEIDDGFYVERVRAVASVLGLSLPKGALTVWNLVGHASDITKLRPAIMSRIIGQGYSLVIIDPLYMLLGDRDESNAGDMTDMMNEFKRLAVRSGAAVAFATHFAKGNAAAKNSIDRSSGSGVLSRYPDVVATLTELEEEECMTFEATLRNNAPMKKFGLRWEYPIFRRDDALDPNALKQPAGAKKERAAESPERHDERRPQSMPEIAQYFPASAEEAVGLGIAMRSAKEGSGISTAAFHAQRARMLEAGWLEQDAEYRWRRTKLGDQFVFDWKNSNSYQQQTTDDHGSE